MILEYETYSSFLRREVDAGAGIKKNAFSKFDIAGFGFNKPARAFAKVDFPAPLLPNIAILSDNKSAENRNFLSSILTVKSKEIIVRYSNNV